MTYESDIVKVVEMRGSGTLKRSDVMKSFVTRFYCVCKIVETFYKDYSGKYLWFT